MIDLQHRIRYDRAVRKPGEPVLLLDPENCSTGQKRWPAETAAGSRQAYCVVVREDIIAADFDQEDGLVRAGNAAKVLLALDLPPVVLESGGKGRAHLWVKVKGTQDKEKVKQLLKEMGADVRGDGSQSARMRPPMSPHRTGKDPILVTPSTDEEALARLEDERTTEIKNVLIQGWEKGHRSEGILRLARTYQKEAIPLDTYLSDVLSHPRGAGEKLHPHGRARRDAEKYLRQTWEKALNWKPTRKTAEIFDEIERQAMQTPWGRSLGARTTLLYLLEIGRKANKLEIHASCRDVAGKAGIRHETASRHMLYLIQEGWIARTGRNRGVDAAKYALIPRAPLPGQDATFKGTPPSPLRGVMGMLQDVRFLDALQGRPSMRQVGAVLDAFGEDGSTVSQLAHALSMKVDSVRRVLNRLGRLVEFDGARWRSRITPEKLDRMAEERGTLGAMANRARIYVRQREDWRREMQERAFRWVRSRIQNAPQPRADAPLIVARA